MALPDHDQKRPDLRHEAYLAYKEAKEKLLSVPGVTGELAEGLAINKASLVLTPSELKEKGLYIGIDITTVVIKTLKLQELLP